LSTPQLFHFFFSAPAFPFLPSPKRRRRFERRQSVGERRRRSVFLPFFSLFFLRNSPFLLSSSLCAARGLIEGLIDMRSEMCEDDAQRSLFLSPLFSAVSFFSSLSSRRWSCFVSREGSTDMDVVIRLHCLASSSLPSSVPFPLLSRFSFLFFPLLAPSQRAPRIKTG